MNTYGRYECHHFTKIISCYAQRDFANLVTSKSIYCMKRTPTVHSPNKKRERAVHTSETVKLIYCQGHCTLYPQHFIHPSVSCLYLYNDNNAKLPLTHKCHWVQNFPTIREGDQVALPVAYDRGTDGMIPFTPSMHTQTADRCMVCLVASTTRCT